MLTLLLRSTNVPQPTVADVGFEEVPIGDEFNDPQGQFSGYDTYDSSQRIQLHKQKHINLRSMVDDDVVTTIPMLYLDLITMNSLNNMTMDDLERTTLVRPGERWTNGTVAVDTTRNNWRILSITCTTGTNYTESIFEK